MSQVTTKWILQLVDQVSGPGKRAQQQANGIGNAYSRMISLGKQGMMALGIGTLSLTALMSGATASAASFQNEFLELKNLNLDKSIEQVESLRKSVLRTAMDTGLSAKQTSKSYFDIQSATGLYGDEVDNIVNKVGKFSIATKASLDSVTNATGKAIGIFKLGSDQIDNYLASMAKTVQVGVTTFDQLSRVQVDYAGAAAAAGQGFDQANKLFAAFTKSAKSVEEAATLTKTAYQGLIDPRVQKGLKQFGINLFDVEGNMLAIDDITQQLVDRLGKMNDQQFSKFMGEVGGPEGLRMLLNQAKANGDGLLQTFKDFDNVQFNVADAIKNANGDARILATLFRNRLDVALTDIGEKTLPMVITALDKMNKLIVSGFGWIEEHGPDVVDWLQSIAFAIGVVTLGMVAWKVATLGLTVVFGALSKVMLLVAALNPFHLIIIAAVALIAFLAQLYQRSERFRGVIMGIVEVFKTFGSVIKEHVLGSINSILTGLGGLGKALGHLVRGQFGQARTAASDAAKDLFGGLVGLSPVGLAKASVQAGKEAGASYKQGWEKGAQAVADGRMEGATFDFSDKSVSTLFDDNKKGNNQDKSVDKDQTSLSGSGGSGKSITMNLDIKNFFNVAEGAMDKIDEIADKVVGKINDKLKDAVIQYG